MATCGRNESGQLGVGDRTDRLGFTQVDAGQLGGVRIVMAACEWLHSVVVSAEGCVWTFGWGLSGGLCLNDEQDRLVPTLLAAEVLEGSKIVTVAAGCAHTMAVGVIGRLWVWGEGSSGQLGDTNDRRVPTLVGAEEVFGGSKVRTIACGKVLLVPTLVPRQLLGGARVGRCHGLALAFAMGTHERLGASSAAAGGVGGRRRSRLLKLEAVNNRQAVQSSQPD
jgi:hypothetical protein